MQAEVFSFSFFVASSSYDKWHQIRTPRGTSFPTTLEWSRSRERQAFEHRGNYGFFRVDAWGREVHLRQKLPGHHCVGAIRSETWVIQNCHFSIFFNPPLPLQNFLILIPGSMLYTFYLKSLGTEKVPQPLNVQRSATPAIFVPTSPMHV